MSDKVKPPLTRPVLLLGEGRDECNFFTAILKLLGRDDVAVDEFGGKRNIGPGCGRP